MEITIKPLIPELAGDYFDFFDYPAEPYYDDVPFHAPAELKEKAVICFEIAPDYRGKGVATALLRIAGGRSGYMRTPDFPKCRTKTERWLCEKN